jgi:signal peptidase I
MTRPRSNSRLREYAATLFWSLAIFLLFRTSVAEAYRIPTPSMESTLLVGDFLFASKFDYGGRLPLTEFRLPGLRAPKAGDIIVFRYPPDPSQNYIKRCIATGGQTIEVRHKRVFVDGEPLDEPYTRFIDPREMSAAFGPRDNFGPYTVPAGHLFMMGDNRDNSADSRYWGPVAMNLVQGRAMFTYYSTAGDSWWSAIPSTRFDRLLRPIH